MAKSRGRKFAELVAPTNGVFDAASIPTIALSKLASSTFSVNSESASLGGNVVLDSNDITEHSSALYFTNTRADSRADVRIAAHNLLARAGGTMTGNLTLGDNVNAYFGASTDLRIYHDGTNSHIINSTGELRVTGSNIAIKSDSAKLYLGASDDLQIYHDGSNSYIKDAGTGALRIAGSQVILRNAADSAHMLRADDGGAVGLYHNSSSKLETTSTGVDVTGNISLSNLTISGTEIDLSSGDLTLDVAGNIILDADGAVVKIQDGGVDLAQLSSGSQNLNIRSLVADKDIRLQGYDGDLSTLVTGLTIDFSDGGRALFGSSVALLSDSNQLQLGAGNDFQIGYDGTDAYLRNHSGGQIILRARTGFLFQANATGGGADDAIRAAQNGAVTLYYDGSAKLATTSTGVQTTGTVNVNGAFALPTSDGSANQILQTNGSGTVSWVTNTGGTSIWSQSGSNIYYSSGNVGIGISSPGTKLDIKTANIGSSSNFAAKAISVRLPFVSGYNNVIASGLGFYDNTIHSTDIGLAYNRNSTGGYDLVFSTNPTTSGSPVERMTINADGNVGIGNSNPQAPLVVQSGTGADAARFIGRSADGISSVGFFNNAQSSSIYLQSNGSWFRARADSGFHWRKGGTPTVTDTDGFTIEGMNVPINTSVDEKIILSGSNDPYIRWQEGTTNKAYMQWNAAGYLQIANQEDASSIEIDSGLTVIPASDEAIVLQGRNDPYIRFQEQTTNKAYIQWNAAGYLTLANQEDASSLRIKDAIEFTMDGSTYHSIWHGGNDGSGSGLDADTLDGVQASSFLRSDASDTTTGLLTVTNDIYLGNSSSRRHLKISSSQWPEVRFFKGTTERYRIGAADANTSYGNQAEGDFYLYSAVHNNMRLNVPIDGSEITRNNGSIIVMDTGSNYQRKAAGIQLGSSSALTNSSSQLALAGNNPYISFHDGVGARTAYLQETGGRFYAGEVTYSETEGSYRAPLFYDVNNTAYYSDQANVSRFNNIRPDTVSTPGSGTATMFVFGKNTGSPDHINFGGSSADPASVSNTVGLSWGTRSDGSGYYLIGVHNYANGYSTHSRLRLAWHTGVELGGHPSYGGVRIMEDSPWVNSTEQARFLGSNGIVFSRAFTDTVSVASPVYYDYNNTAYYLDPAGTGTAFRTAGSWRQDSTSWTGEIPGKFQYHSSQWYLQSASGGFNFRNSAGTNTFYGDNSANVFATGSYRAPVFYDSANTAYYLDPNASGTAFRTSGSWRQDSTNWTGEIAGKIQYHSNQWYFQSAQGIFHFRNSSGTNVVYSDASANIYSTGSFRAPIFYDSANAAFYVDPASTSVLNNLTVNASIIMNDNQVFRQEGRFTTNTSGQNTNSGDQPYAFGYQIAGAWSHPYPDLILGFHTGVRLGGHTNYGGCRFYGDHPSRNSTIVFSTNNGDLHVRAANNIYAYTSDKRLKENFRPIENAVDKVKALGGFIFDWRKDMMDKHAFTPDQEKNDAGLIAQEVQEVMPAAIRRAPFDYDPNEPNQSKSGEEFLTVQYEKMVPLLVEAIKEQQKQIDELKKLLEEKE